MSKPLKRLLPFGLISLVVLAFLFGGLLGESTAAPESKVDIAFLYITGEGATAKAWFDGVASPGLPVQDALDKFSKEGYRVARTTDNLRSTEDAVAFTILLQRVSP
jgi:hypothetical protein